MTMDAEKPSSGSLNRLGALSNARFQLKNGYASSVISTFAVLCGGMALVTVGAWMIFAVRSPFELLFTGVVGALPIALLGPLYEETEHPLDRFVLTLSVCFLSTLAFIVADALIWWVS